MTGTHSLPGTEADALLSLRGVHKRFPGVHALRGVDLDVRRSEVHAVVGENGAGKSTLMQILAGVYLPDAGRIDFDGRSDCVFHHERAAQEAGVAIVYQERSLFGPLSIADNVFAGRQPRTRFGRIDHGRLRRETRELLTQVGLDVDPETPVERLSFARQQLVEIAKALSIRAKLIIFDEPTAALADAEVQTLFRIVRRLRDDGAAVIYISHRLDEVFLLADRVTVLRDGTGQGTSPVLSLTPRQLVARMVGRDVNPHQQRADGPRHDSPVRLDVRGISDDPDRTDLRPRLTDCRFTVRAGEIVALAGLVGAGRTELALAVFGCRSGVTGEVRVDGQLVRLGSPARAIAAGIGYLPEDRKDDGLFLEMGVADNIASAAAGRFGTWRYNVARQHAVAAELCRSLKVVCRGTEEPVRQLSGGNQQKVVLARWLLAEPKVLIVDEPTRGVDVGAKAEIHNLLFDLARGGTAVIVSSSDLPEVLALADRVLVMREGQIAGELLKGQATESSVMELAAMGASDEC
jgi:ABC-type sugar transport system ATPase subunit